MYVIFWYNIQYLCYYKQLLFNLIIYVTNHSTKDTCSLHAKNPSRRNDYTRYRRSNWKTRRHIIYLISMWIVQRLVMLDCNQFDPFIVFRKVLPNFSTKRQTNYPTDLYGKLLKRSPSYQNVGKTKYLCSIIIYINIHNSCKRKLSSMNRISSLSEDIKIMLYI